MKDGVAAKQYVDLELLNKQVKEIEQTIQLTDREIENAILALAMLDEFSSADTSSEVLIPLGSGAFCSVQAGSIKTIKMAVGAGVLIERTADDAKTGLQTQLQELKNHRENSLDLHDQLIEKIISLQQDIEAQLATKNGTRAKK